MVMAQSLSRRVMMLPREGRGTAATARNKGRRRDLAQTSLKIKSIKALGGGPMGSHTEMKRLGLLQVHGLQLQPDLSTV